MAQNNQREVVLIVGSTGSLGKSLVEEFRLRGVPLRLLGRSRESFVKAGFTQTEGSLDLVICADVTDRTAYRDEWFVDVKAVLCVARPRWSKKDDREEIMPLVQNLSDAVCSNGVPCMLLLGRPYVETYTLGMTPHMKMLQDAEACARARFEAQPVDPVMNRSSLTIARVAEMSELGHLLEIARSTRLWLCVWGCDPQMQPISSRDFANAVARLVDEERIGAKAELLLGGPQTFSWRQLGCYIEDAIGKKLFVMSVPLLFFRVTVQMWRYVGKVIPVFEGLANVLQIACIPMTAEATSEEHENVGQDLASEYLKEHAKPGKATDVRNRVFGAH